MRGDAFFFFFFFFFFPTTTASTNRLLNLDLDVQKHSSFKNTSTDDPLPPGVTLPPDDLDDFGGLGSILSLGRRGGGGGGGGQGQGAGTAGGTAAAGNVDAWQDLALGELQ